MVRSVTQTSQGVKRKEAEVRANRIYNRLIDGGLTRIAATGIMGNISKETGGSFDPSKRQDSKKIGDGLGPGRGLVQYGGNPATKGKVGGRFDEDKENLIKFSKGTGKDWDDLDNQVDFILHELNTVPEFKKVKASLQKANSIAEATQIFQYKFEKDLSSANATKSGETNKNLEDRVRRSESWGKKLPEDTRTATPAEDEKRTATPSADANSAQEDDDVFAPSATPSADQNISETNVLPDDNNSGEVVVPSENLPEEDPVPPLDFANKDEQLEVRQPEAQEPEAPQENALTEDANEGSQEPTTIPSIDMNQATPVDKAVDSAQEASQDLMDDVITSQPTLPNLPISMPETGSDAQYTTPSNPQSPLKKDNIPNEAFDRDVLGDLLVSDKGTPQISTLRPYQEKPGFVETIGHNLNEMNIGLMAGQYAYNEFMKKNPTHDPVPEGFTAMSPEVVEGFDSKYWPFLTSAVSPNDVTARQQRVREQMAEDVKFSNGSLFTTLLGGGLGILTDPLTYVIPMAAGAKYAKLSQNVLMNMAKISPGMAMDSVARNTMLQARKAGGNVQDAATDSLRDFVFGTALIGAGSALGHAKRAGTLWKTRRAFNFAADGVVINPVVKDGVIVKDMEASIPEGLTASMESLTMTEGERMDVSLSQGKNAMYIGAANGYIEELSANSGAFGKKFLGAALTRVLGNDYLGTPVMQAARSPYKAVQSFFNRTAFTGSITQRTIDGEARNFTAHEYATYYRDYARDVAGEVRGLFYKANGIAGSTETGKAFKNFQQAVTENRTISEEGFGQEIRSILNTKGYESKHPEAHEAAETIHKFFKGMGEDVFTAMGKEGTFLDPLTAWKYLPQNYNIPEMVNNPQKWMDITVGEYKKQDETMRALTQPVTDTDARIKTLQDRLAAAGAIDKKSSLYKVTGNQLKEARQLLKRQLDDQVKELRNNSDHHILLESRVMFDSAEAAQLETILKPVTSAEAKISKEKTKVKKLTPKSESSVGALNKANKELLKTKKASSKSKDKTSEVFYEAKVSKQEAEVELLKTKSKADSMALKKSESALLNAEDELLDANNAIKDGFYEGRIDKKFVKNEGFEDFALHDPKVRPKLRAPFSSLEHMSETAGQVFNSITNNTPEDLIMGVFGHIDASMNASPSHLKSRSHLVSSEAYNKTNFLDPDVTKSVSAYAASMGRIIGFKRAFPEFASGIALPDKSDIGKTGILVELEKEHKERLRSFKYEEGTKEGNKERTRVAKEFQDAKDFMKDTYNIYMGTYAKHNPKWQKKVQAMKNLVASAKLGAVPVYQIAELGSILMKSSIMPFFSDGLKPLIKTLGGNTEGRESEAFLNNAGNAHLGINHVRNGYAAKLVDSDTTSYVSVGGATDKMQALAEGAAHLSGNLYGINAMANLNERVMASTYQSEVMQAMFAHQEGTLTKEQNGKMLHYGLDVRNDSMSFVKNFERSEGWKQDRGYQSAYWAWEDAGASNKMAMSIRRAVQDTVVNGNIFTSPYWTNNPIPGMVFMFHGWAYGALNHYTIPMMQRPTAEMMLGLVSTVGLSMMADPLLRVVNGKEPYSDDDSWFDRVYKGMDYSGIMGPFASYLQDVNTTTGGVFAPGLQTERTKYVNQWPGPIAGYFGDVIKSGQHIYKGDRTQGDARREASLIPLSSNLAIRYLLGKYIGSTDLPEKRGQAEPSPWYTAFYGDK